MRGPAEGQPLRPFSEFITSGNRNSMGWQSTLDDMNPTALDEDFKTELQHVVTWFSYLSDLERREVLRRMLLETDLGQPYLRLAHFLLKKTEPYEPPTPVRQSEDDPQADFSKFCSELDASASSQQLPMMLGLGMDPRHLPAQSSSMRLKNPPPPIGSGSPSRPVSLIENNHRNSLDRFPRWSTPSSERPKSADYSLFNGPMPMFLGLDKSAPTNIPHTVPEAEEHQDALPVPSFPIEPPGANRSPAPVPTLVPAADVNLDDLVTPFAKPVHDTTTQHHSIPATSKTPQDRVMGDQIDANISDWLKRERLHKYTDNLRSKTWSEMINLTEDELQALGVSAIGARRKMLKAFEEFRKADSTN